MFVAWGYKLSQNTGNEADHDGPENPHVRPPSIAIRPVPSDTLSLHQKRPSAEADAQKLACAGVQRSLKQKARARHPPCLRTKVRGPVSPPGDRASPMSRSCSTPAHLT